MISWENRTNKVAWWVRLLILFLTLWQGWVFAKVVGALAQGQAGTWWQYTSLVASRWDMATSTSAVVGMAFKCLCCEFHRSDQTMVQWTGRLILNQWATEGEVPHLGILEEEFNCSSHGCLNQTSAALIPDGLPKSSFWYSRVPCLSFDTICEQRLLSKELVLTALMDIWEEWSLPHRYYFGSQILFFHLQLKKLRPQLLLQRVEPSICRDIV